VYSNKSRRRSIITTKIWGQHLALLSCARAHGWSSRWLSVLQPQLGVQYIMVGRLWHWIWQGHSWRKKRQVLCRYSSLWWCHDYALGHVAARCDSDGDSLDHLPEWNGHIAKGRAHHEQFQNIWGTRPVIKIESLLVFSTGLNRPRRVIQKTPFKRM